MAGSVSYVGIVDKLPDGSDGTGPGYTTVLLSDGTTQTFTGSRGFRNNNPGNLASESFSASTLARYEQNGVLGYDYGGYMVFSSMQGGFNAQKSLVFGPVYEGRTIGGMISGDLNGDGEIDTKLAYASPLATNDPNGTNETYLDQLALKGWDPNTPLSDLTPEQQNELIADMIRVENTTEDAEKILSQVDPENATTTDFSSQNNEGEDTVSERSGEGTAGQSQPRNDGFAPSTGDIGFKDPDKTFVVPGYEDNRTVTFNARGEWQPKIVPPQGNPFEIPLEAQPEYPHNKVTESTNSNPEERHRIEIDDTKGGERVTINHYIGTAVEMWNEGELIVNSFGKMVQLVGENFEMFVAGNGTVIYKGDLDFTVEGDMHLKVKGDMQTTVFGNKSEVVHKKKIENYRKDQSTIVVGNKTSVVSETNTEMVLGNKNTFVDKKQSNWVEGDIEFLSGENTHISSQKTLSMAATDNINAASGAVFSATSTVVNLDGASSLDITSPTMTVNANNLDIFSATTLDISTATGNWHAAAGTLGGPGVYHYGAGWDGTLNVFGATVMSGSLDVGGGIKGGAGLNIANNAKIGGYLDATGEITSADDITAFGTVVSPTDPNDVPTDGSSAFLEPTTGNITTTLSPLSTTLAAVASTLTTTLTASEEGIMQVSVDPGDKIKQTIDLRERISLGLGL